MAIVRSAGTEIIRCSAHYDVDEDTPLIIGVQHHIYTVLSVIIYATAVNSSASHAFIRLVGYDSEGGTSGVTMEIFKTPMAAGQTFVWNDKFSFNGAEPADFAGPLSDTTKQDAIADQDDGNSSYVAQKLRANASSGGDNYNYFVTYIDQNNA